ncbi:MAG: phenylalanine--tRNA ligase subunit beta [Patescibacteria group bacterium]|nr:phenylalanine--tRNA ligase subunit beta [Patescibacteria group bacterium]
MYISLDWLKDYVKIPKNVSFKELGEKLTLHTVEIDDVIKEADKYKDIVVGKILKVEAHPNADKLQLAIVDIKTEELKIVCGASNIKGGQKVPVALIGAVLSNGLEIKETKIRGIKSLGMLCAEDELGLGDDHSGILILDEKAKVGQDLADYLELKDVIYEVDNKSITNRPDLWGHFGLARDIAVFLDAPFNDEIVKKSNEEIYIDKNEYKFNIKVDDKKLCPRYLAVAMDNIEIKESPAWLRKRLIATGVRPINNIVDITNYVMLETGQPMHAFDAYDVNSGLDKDKEIKIGIRRAKKNEKLKTLDGVEQELDEEILLITNQEKAVAVAGVMGGENSEIDDKTRTIVLEAANFDFVSIRKTSTKLGLRTEASKRFEKSLDPALCKLAGTRAIELIKSVCPGAKVAGAVADINNYKNKIEPIELDLNWLDRMIGFETDKDEVSAVLFRLGFSVEALDESKLKVGVPGWRAAKDVSIPEDLLEEVARIYGYNNITPLMPKVEMKAPEMDQLRKFENDIKKMLALAGLNEVYNYAFVDAKQLARMGINSEKHIRLINPIAKDKSLLCQSLLTNMISNVALNQARNDKIDIFEIANVFLPIDGSESRSFGSKDVLPSQEKHLAILCAGEAKLDLMAKTKGWLELLSSKLNLDLKYVPQEIAPDWVEGGQSAQIIVNGELLGFINKADQKMCKKCGVKKQFVIAEIKFNDLFKIYERAGIYQFKEFTRFPSLARDLAFVVSEKVLYNDIKEEILNFHDYIKSVELFDVYRGEKLGQGNKNLAFHVNYQAGKTLTGEEVDDIQAGLLKKLEERFEAKIRDF